MFRDPIDLNYPMFGKVEKMDCSRESAYIRWAPGNGYAYIMMLSRCSEESGADVLVSIKDPFSEVFVSYPMSFFGFYGFSYVEEKFGYLIKDEKTLKYFVALMNWCLPGVTEDSKKYAQEIFESI